MEVNIRPAFSVNKSIKRRGVVYCISLEYQPKELTELTGDQIDGRGG